MSLSCYLEEFKKLEYTSATMRQSIEQGTNLEQEPKPKIQVIFYGWDHYLLNLQGRENLKKTLIDSFQNTSGRRFIFIESAADSQSNAERMSRYLKKKGSLIDGFWASVLRMQSSVEPTESEILAQKMKVPLDDL